MNFIIESGPLKGQTIGPTTAEPIGTQPTLTLGPEYEAPEETTALREAGRGIVRAGLRLARGITGTLASAATGYALLGGGRAAGRLMVAEDALSRHFEKKMVDWRADPQTGAQRIASFVGEMLPTLGAYVAAAIVHPVVGIGLAAATEGQDAYDNAVRRGASDAEAQRERLIVGAVNATLSSINVGKLLKFGPNTSKAMGILRQACDKGVRSEIVKAGGKLTSQVLKNGLAIGFNAAAQEGVTIAVPGLHRGDLPRDEEGQIAWGDILDRLGTGFIGGMAIGTALGGLSVAARLRKGEGIIQPFNPAGKYADLYQAKIQELTKKYTRKPRVWIEETARREAVKAQLGPTAQVISKRWGQAASDRVYDLIASYGGVPDNPDIQPLWIDTITDALTKAKRWETRLARWAAVGKPIHAMYGMDWFASAKRAIDNLSMRSGQDISSIWDDIDVKRMAALQDAEKLYQRFEDVVLRTGVSKADLVKVSQALFTGKRADLDSPKLLEVYDTVNGLLQDEMAWRVRKIQFERMREGQYTPPGTDPKTGKPWDTRAIVAQGITVRRLGERAFNGWLKRQQWGTRQAYWMSDSIQHVGEIHIGGLTPVRGKPVVRKGAKPSSIEARKYADQIKRGDPAVNLLNHIKRTVLASEIYRPITRLRQAVNRIPNLSGRDTELFEDIIDNMLDRAVERHMLLDLNSKMANSFWKTYFTVRGPIFGALNWMQGVLFGPILGRKAALAWPKTLAKYLADPTWRARYAKDVAALPTGGQSGLSAEMRMQLSSKMRLDVLSRSRLGRQLLRWHRAWMDFWAKTDSTARRFTYLVSHAQAWDAVQRFKAGQVRQAITDLNLGVFSPMARLKMLTMLDRGQLEDFVRYYAKVRTDATNFRYERYQRSAIEQKPLASMILGVITYPRGMAELVMYHGALPMVQGIRRRDVDLFVSGLGVTVSYVVANEIQDMMETEILGRRTTPGVMPGIPTLLSPPLGQIVKMATDINVYLVTRAPGKTTKQIIDDIATIGERRLEVFFPALSVTNNLWEAMGDKRNFNAITELRKRIYGTKSAAKKQERTMWESLLHAIGGAFEKPERRD